MVNKVFRLLRVTQWLKNLLVFLPVVASHSWSDIHKIKIECITFLALSLSASIGYIFNDILDSKFDSLHPRKKLRPIAAGEVSRKLGFLAIQLLVLADLAVMYFLPRTVNLMILTYLSMSILYSFKLKKLLLLDLFCLSALFMLRILIGGAAIGVTLSIWLLSFSCFFFWSLASQKRVAELVLIRTSSNKGRAYLNGDEFTLGSAGISSAFCAILLSVFYTYSQASDLYRNPHYLYGICGIIGYWIVRSWILVFRETLSDDPISFFISDSASLCCLIISCVLFYVAI